MLQLSATIAGPEDSPMAQPQDPAAAPARAAKYKFSEGEKVLCYEPDSSKAKVLYDSKVLQIVVDKDSRGRKAPQYRIHFSGWSRSWDRCVSEESILPVTPENRKLQKKLAEEAAQNLIQTGKTKRRKVPAILKESLDRRLRGSGRKERSGSGSSSSGEEYPENSSGSEQQGDDSDEKDSDDEPQEIATDYNIPIPSILRNKLEDDCYNITIRKKLIRIPCTPDVVDILEAYLKYYAAKLSVANTRPTKGGSSRPPPLEPAEVDARFALCKEAMDGLRVMFSCTFPNILLYSVERSQYNLVTTYCRPIRITRPATSGLPNEAIIFSVTSPLNIAPDVASTVKCRSRKKTQSNTTPKNSPTLPRRRPSASPPEKRSLRLSEHNTISSDSPANRSGAQDESDSDNLPLSVSVMGRAPRRRTASICSATSSVSAAPSEAQPSTGGGRFDCSLLPEDVLQNELTSPALLYGAQHFLRLFVKLPAMLKQMQLTKRKAEYLEKFLVGLLHFMAGRQEELFPSSIYRDAEDVMAELEKYKTRDG